MKLFSQIRSCWSGAVPTPASESAGVARHKEDHGGECGRTSKRIVKMRGGAAAHDWKPRLNAISENSPMAEEANSGGSQRNGYDSKVQPTLAEDYWDLSKPLSLPAFSPTSYLF